MFREFRHMEASRIGPIDVYQNVLAMLHAFRITSPVEPVREAATDKVTLKFKLFQQVALAKDIPPKKLRRGDLATIVDTHPVTEEELGYSTGIFNAGGNTIVVTAVTESFLQEPTNSETYHVRSLAGCMRGPRDRRHGIPGDCIRQLPARTGAPRT